MKLVTFRNEGGPEALDLARRAVDPFNEAGLEFVFPTQTLYTRKTRKKSRESTRVITNEGSCSNVRHA
jgi:hypothetical protein